MKFKKVMLSAMILSICNFAHAKQSQTPTTNNDTLTGCFTFGPNQCPAGSGPLRISGGFHFGPQVDSQSAVSSSLSGTYAVQTTDCLNVIPDYAAFPLEVVVKADSAGAEYFLKVNIGGYQGALQDIMHMGAMPTGTNTNHVLGDGFFRTSGFYTNNADQFTYAEFENSDQNPAFQEIRSTQLVLQGSQLQILETEAAQAPRVCLLTKVQ